MFVVRYEIDIPADTPQEAAARAAELLAQPGTPAMGAYTVTDPDGQSTLVDLAEPPNPFDEVEYVTIVRVEETTSYRTVPKCELEKIIGPLTDDLDDNTSRLIDKLDSHPGFTWEWLERYAGITDADTIIRPAEDHEIRDSDTLA